MSRRSQTDADPADPANSGERAAGGGRGRGAATRVAILTAARLRFTAAGYDQVGVREIAADAGVDAALVIRHFRSKERLFAEAVTDVFRVDDLIAGERADFGRHCARAILGKAKGGDGFDPMLALLRSVASDQAAPLIRADIDRNFVAPLAAWLGGPAAGARAGLIAATLTGLAVVRDIVGSASLRDTELEMLVALVAPTLQAYVDGRMEIAVGIE